MMNDDLALTPVTINFAPGPEYSEKARKWQGIPGIERASNGRLWATWYTGGRTEDENNHVVLVTSADAGLTWSEPVLVIDPPGDVRASDPVLWHDPSGRLWLFWMQTAHCGMTFDGRGGVWAITCEDSGAVSPVWSAPRRLANGIMMNKPTVLSTGEWLLPCAVWSHRGPWRISLPDEQYSNVIVSRDQGGTFERLGYADVPNRGPDEHMIVERRDGSLWMLVRRKDGIGEAISHDRGRTWTARPHAVLAGPNARFHIRRLRSGRLLLINHHGFMGRSHLTALLSEDDGATWPCQLLLDERDQVSYPDAIETPDGFIRVIYDRHRVGEGEILTQTFREDDVLRNGPGAPPKPCSDGDGRRVFASHSDAATAAGVAQAPAAPAGHESGRIRMISHVHRENIGSRRVVFMDNYLVDHVRKVTRQRPAGWRDDGADSTAFTVDEEGELLIDPVWFAGTMLSLDCATAKDGFIRAEVQDWAGLPIKGYTLKECIEIQGERRDRTVRWTRHNDVGALEGQLIRLRFAMCRADLHGFRFRPAAGAETRTKGVASGHPLLGRRLCVADSADISPRALRKALHGESGYETGFVMSGAPVSPKNQTRFVVRRRGGKLVIGALLHLCNRDDAMDLGASAKGRYPGSVSLSFSPRGDGTGFITIGFAEGRPPGYNSFLPYPEARSTRWPLLRPLAWNFEHYVNAPGSIFESREVLFRAVFDERTVFALSDAVGFNVTRGDAAARETSSWSFATGMNCDGLLLRSASVDCPVPQAPALAPAGRFVVGLTNDPLMVLAQRPYTQASLEGELRTLKQWGLDRYHWIDNTGYQAMLPGYPSLRGANYLRSRRHCGELLPAACQAAHRQELDIIADVKLFDLAWLGEPDPKQRGRRTVFDGAVFLPMPQLKDLTDAFMTAHPAWLRRAKFPITVLRLYSLDPLPALKAADIRLSQSADNIRYRLVRGEKIRVVVREVRRPNRRWGPDGVHPDEGSTTCWVMEVSGFQITQPFLAFEASGTDASLLNRQFAAVEAVSSDGTEAPFLIGSPVHATIAGPGNVSPGKPRRFAFSAAMGGWLTQDEPIGAIRRWPLRELGLAFVVPETLPGLLEPTHPSAAQAWLERIEFCLDAGVDGVSIRTLRHHNGCPSWTQYAYAPTVRARFEARYGRPVEPTDEDVARVHELRGEAFGGFLAEASRRVKARGKRFIFQMEVVGGALNAVNSRMAMTFNLERWMAEGLFDEIHVKINTGHSPWIRTALLPFARRHGVAVHLITPNASAGYGHADYRISERLVGDAMALGYDGVNFYESANLYELTEGDTIQARGMGEACLRRAVEMAGVGRNTPRTG